MVDRVDVWEKLMIDLFKELFGNLFKGTSHSPVECLRNQSPLGRNIFMMKKLALLITAVVILNGCSSPKSIGAEDFDPFYKNIYPAPSKLELKLFFDDADKQELLRLVMKDYEKLAGRLDNVSQHFIALAENLNSETAEIFVNAGELLSALSGDFLAESKYLQTLYPTCPLSWDESKRKEIEDCGRATLRWGTSADRAIACTYHFIALDFENIQGFERKDVNSFDDYSDKNLESCWFFKDSNRLFGYPVQVGVTWIPERFQEKFLKQDQMFVVEIAQNLYTAWESEGSLLTNALYGSWHGSCSVYAKYENLLREGGYLLGNIKNGTCS